MKQSELEKYLGQIVEVTLFNGKTDFGELHKTGEERFKNDPNYYYPHNYYFLLGAYGYLNCYLFRCSHVKKLAPKGRAWFEG